MKRVVNKDNLKKFIDLINGKPNKPVKGVLNKKPSTGKPNIEKTDWETRFDKTFLNIRFDTTVGTSVNIKDFISQLLKTQREEIISEIIDLVKENRKGTFTDDGGNDCWYIDDLVKELKILENKE